VPDYLRRSPSAAQLNIGTSRTSKGVTDQIRRFVAFALIGSMELRMSSPSIIPNDRLDRDIYLVLEDFHSGSGPMRQIPTSRRSSKGFSPVSTISRCGSLFSIQSNVGRAMLPRKSPKSWTGGFRLKAARFPRRYRSSSSVTRAERPACSWRCRCAASEDRRSPHEATMR
jgi:hypothetical protein